MATPNMGLQPGQFQPSEEEMQALMKQYGFDPRKGFVPSGSGAAPNAQYNANYNPATGKQGPTGDVGSNPYPQNRYAYSGPQFNASNGTPIDNLYGGYDPYYGSAIDKMAQNNRSLALSGGLQLGQDLNNYTNFQYGQAGNFQDKLNSAYDPIAQGQGGYSDQEKAAILNNPYLQSLQLTPEQQQSNYLTGGEQQGISGDPYSGFNYSQGQAQNQQGLYGNFATQIGDDLGNQESAINSGLQGAGTNMRNAIYDNQSKTYQDLSDIGSLTRGQVGDTASHVRGSLGYSQGLVGNQLDQTGQRLGSALGSQASGVRSYIDPSHLTTSPEYQSTYQVGPQDMQGIMNQAGRQVGAQSAMDEETLQQQANAQGNSSPLAQATMRNRIRQTGAVNQANAMSDAAIKAKQLQLTTEQQRENTRLGAEQNYAGLGSSAEMGLGNQQVQAAQQYGSLGTNAALGLGNQAVSAEYGLGQQGLQNEQYMGSNTLSQQNQLAASQLGAEQYLASQNLAGQQYLGNSRLQNTQSLMNTGLGVGQFNSQQGLGALQTGEQNSSNRAGTLANTRLSGNQYNQTQEAQRGQYIYGQGNQANTNFANQRLGQEGEYRGYLSGAQTQANQNTAVGNQQRVGLYGGINQGLQGATQGAIQNYAVPSMGQNLFGTIFGGAASVGGKFVPGHASGTVTQGPQKALIGEAGPELVVDLDSGNKYGGVSNPMYDRLRDKVYKGDDKEEEMAGGGVVGGHHYFGSKSKLKEMGMPHMKLVSKPTITTLGVKGPQAVIPLTPRKSNKVSLGDIPNLLKKYGGRV